MGPLEWQQCASMHQHQHKTYSCKCKCQWGVCNLPCFVTQGVHACPPDLLKHVQVNMAMPGTLEV
eukprot:80392-Lingulodinium_polyedra.AAC.1